nr:MAG TPA: hypothetical protein [Caudoviricetes sp.]
MAKYNRFIKFDSLNLNVGKFESVILNMDSIDSIFPKGAKYNGKDLDVLYSKNKKDPYYIPSDSDLIENLKQLGDMIYDIQRLK